MKNIIKYLILIFFIFIFTPYVSLQNKQADSTYYLHCRRKKLADSTYYRRYEVKSGWVSYKVMYKKKKIGRLELFFEEYGSKECFYYQTDSARMAICKTDSIQFDPFVPLVKTKRKRTLPFELVNFYEHSVHHYSSVIREDSLGFLPYIGKRIKGFKCRRYIERSHKFVGFTDVCVFKGIPIRFRYWDITFTLEKSNLLK